MKKLNGKYLKNKMGFIEMELTNMSLLKILYEKIEDPFSKDFLIKYFESGFGSLSKNDIDLLVYHLLEKHTQIFNDKSEYDISTLLMITERKLKNIQIDSYLKYQDKNLDENLRKIIKKIKSREIVPEFDGDKIRFLIESPVLKRDFEYAIKSMGYIIDYSFNKDIINFRLSSFFSVINNISPDQINEIKGSIIEHFKLKKIADKELGKELENKSWWIEQVKSLGATAKKELASHIAVFVISHLGHLLN